MHVLTTHAENCNGIVVDPTESAIVEKETRTDIARVDSTPCTSSRFGACPLCNARLPLLLLTAHAESCNGKLDRDKPNQEITEIHEEDKHEQTAKRSWCEKQSEESKGQHSLTPWWKQTKQSKIRIDNPILPTCEPLPGLYLFEEFITQDEEDRILSQLDGLSPEHRHEFLPWKHSTFNGSSKGKRWGVHCNLRDRRVSEPEHAMPHFFNSILVEKLKRILPMAGCIPNEANAIDYRRKQGHWLKSHVDDRQLSREPIANLSVAGDCYMTFRNERVVGEESKRVLLTRRTLQVLTGKARYDYSHGICNTDLLSDRRVSITMRESPLTKTEH